jgi:hypothetical protein
MITRGQPNVYAPPVTEFQSDSLTDDSFKTAYTNPAEFCDYDHIWTFILLPIFIAKSAVLY